MNKLLKMNLPLEADAMLKALEELQKKDMMPLALIAIDINSGGKATIVPGQFYSLKLRHGMIDFDELKSLLNDAVNGLTIRVEKKKFKKGNELNPN